MTSRLSNRPIAVDRSTVNLFERRLSVIKKPKSNPLPSSTLLKDVPNYDPYDGAGKCHNCCQYLSQVSAAHRASGTTLISDLTRASPFTVAESRVHPAPCGVETEDPKDTGQICWCRSWKKHQPERILPVMPTFLGRSSFSSSRSRDRALPACASSPGLCECLGRRQQWHRYYVETGYQEKDPTT